MLSTETGKLDGVLTIIIRQTLASCQPEIIADRGVGVRVVIRRQTIRVGKTVEVGSGRVANNTIVVGVLFENQHDVLKDRRP